MSTPDKQLMMKVQVESNRPADYKAHVFREAEWQFAERVYSAIRDVHGPIVVEIKQVYDKWPGVSTFPLVIELDTLELRCILTPVQHRDITMPILPGYSYADLPQKKGWFDRFVDWLEKVLTKGGG